MTDQIREKIADDNTIINIAGEPCTWGLSSSYQPVLMILAITILAIFGMLYVYYRSKRACLCRRGLWTSAIWGLGFMSLMGITLPADDGAAVSHFPDDARHSMQFMAVRRGIWADRQCKTGITKYNWKHVYPGLTSIVTMLGNSAGGIATIPVLMKIRLPARFGRLPPWYFHAGLPRSCFLYPWIKLF